MLLFWDFYAIYLLLLSNSDQSDYTNGTDASNMIDIDLDFA